MQPGDTLHFVGIGGAGMAPLAEILLQQGYHVSGSDRAENGKTEELRKLGAKIFIGHHKENLPENAVLSVFSSAVPEENPERRRARELGIPELRRGAMLAQLAANYRRCVAVSGSHGKSTTSAMLVHILRSLDSRPGYLVGAGFCDGSPSSDAGKGNDIFVTEADESDATHTLLAPALGIVPNVESDHAWSVGGEAVLYANFAAFGARSGKLLYLAGPQPDRLFADHPDALRLPAFPADERYLNLHGFQAWNGRLAVEAALLLGFDREQAEKALLSFPGIARRMTVRLQGEKFTLIEDYAHHPTEVRASLQWLRQSYPDHFLRVIFQPHRYARLACYLEELAAALALADEVLVTPVFAAWSETGKVDSSDLVRKIGPKARLSGADWEKSAEKLSGPGPDDRPLLAAVIGAGDVDQLFGFLKNVPSWASTAAPKITVQPHSSRH